jgi:hypothetical protein
MLNEEDHLRLQGFIPGSRWSRHTPRWIGWTPNWDNDFPSHFTRVWLPYQLPHERRDRTSGIGLDPPAGAGADEGDLESPAGARPGGAHLPRVVRGRERGRRQLLPALQPDDSRQVGNRAPRPPGQDGSPGDRLRRAGSAGAVTRRADDYRRQGLARVRAASVRPLPVVRRSDEPPQRRTARGGCRVDRRGGDVHAEQAAGLHPARAFGRRARPGITDPSSRFGEHNTSDGCSKRKWDGAHSPLGR